MSLASPAAPSEVELAVQSKADHVAARIGEHRRRLHEARHKSFDSVTR